MNASRTQLLRNERYLINGFKVPYPNSAVLLPDKALNQADQGRYPGKVRCDAFVKGWQG
jgi:hypothetical protein